MFNSLVTKATLRLIGQATAKQVTTPLTRISGRYTDLDTDHTIVAAPGAGYRIVIPFIAIRNASTTNNPFTVFSAGAYNINGLNELVGFKVSAGASGGTNPNTTHIPVDENTLVNLRNVTATGTLTPDVYFQLYYYIERV